MDRLKQVFNILQHSNFIPLVEWCKIYPKDNVPIESQNVFVNWLNTNNLNVLQDSIRGILYFENKENKQNLKIEDFKNTFPEWYTYNKPFKRSLHIISKTCVKFDPDCLSGWLSPTGKFFECEWGEHESYAGKIVHKNDLVDKYKTFKKETNSYLRKDFIINNCNYVLFDNPSNNGYVTISYSKLNKTQKDFIVDYLIKIGDNYTLNKILEF